MAHSSITRPILNMSSDLSAYKLAGWLMELFMKFFWVIFISKMLHYVEVTLFFEVFWYDRWNLKCYWWNDSTDPYLIWSSLRFQLIFGMEKALQTASPSYHKTSLDSQILDQIPHVLLILVKSVQLIRGPVVILLRSSQWGWKLLLLGSCMRLSVFWWRDEPFPNDLVCHAKNWPNL